jgi:hypothetical protein
MVVVRRVLMASVSSNPLSFRLTETSFVRFEKPCGGG